MPIKASTINYLLWHKYYRHSKIKDSIPTAHSLYKHTWVIVVYIVLTGKKSSGPDIWPKTPQQTKSTKNIMRTSWNGETMLQQKSSEKLNCPLASIGKEAKYICALLFCD